MDLLILRSDGGVSRMRTRDGVDLAREIEAWEASVAKDGWTAIGYREVQGEELPPRRFRGAWTLPTGVDGPIVVDVAKARNLRKDELERRRATLLERLREKIEEAEDLGQAARLANLKAKRKAARSLDLAAKLQEISDLAVLDTFVPSEMADP